MSNFYKLFGPLFLGASLIASNFGTADARTVEFNACHPSAVKVGTTTVRAVGMHNISPSGYFTLFSATSSMNSMFAGVQGDGVYYEFKSNNDKNLWAKVRNGGMAIVASQTAAMNDWLITPAITLKGGEVYMMTLAMDAMYSNVNESFEVKMGQTATASGLKTAVLPKTNITADAAPIVMMLRPTADGKYYKILYRYPCHLGKEFRCPLCAQS